MNAPSARTPTRAAEQEGCDTQEKLSNGSCFLREEELAPGLVTRQRGRSLEGVAP